MVLTLLGRPLCPACPLSQFTPPTLTLTLEGRCPLTVPSDPQFTPADLAAEGAEGPCHVWPVPLPGPWKHRPATVLRTPGWTRSPFPPTEAPWALLRPSSSRPTQGASVSQARSPLCPPASREGARGHAPGRSVLLRGTPGLGDFLSTSASASRLHLPRVDSQGKSITSTCPGSVARASPAQTAGPFSPGALGPWEPLPG